MNVFDPLKIRGVISRNRIMMSPMCMYSSADGCANDFHLFHYTTRAMGGAGIIMIEATAIDPSGLISPDDLRLYNEKQMESFKKLSKPIKSYGALVGIQLAHAGRKAGTYAPNKGHGKIPIGKGGWTNISPSPIQYTSNWPIPREMDINDIEQTVKNFGSSAELAERANIDIVEIHAAHGYLIHEFLSPITNKRNDLYGGTIEGRIRFLLEIVNEIRSRIREDTPLFVRISGNDFHDGGWTIEDSAFLARELYKNGVDLIDCSSGGIIPGIKIPNTEAYNLDISKAIKKNSEILTSVVGNINSMDMMNSIVDQNYADMVTLGRLLLRDPYWPARNASNYFSKSFFPLQYRDGFR